MVRACLGADAIAEHKLEAGMPLTVLGIETTLTQVGITFRPSEDKRQKWIAKIRTALQQDKLIAGEASKLVGALQWSTQHSFRRLGRAMLTPLNRCACCSPTRRGSPGPPPLQPWSGKSYRDTGKSAKN